MQNLAKVRRSTSRLYPLAQQFLLQRPYPPLPPLIICERVVIDTNVLVSILVFDDPHHRPLREMWRNGRIAALTTQECCSELARVLRYPQFNLSADAVDAAYAEYIRHAVEMDALPCATLPKCSDADDQKFLELAYTADAASLLTGDKALLELRRKVRFRIETPELFLQGMLKTATPS